jgi:hypothetical protein
MAFAVSKGSQLPPKRRGWRFLPQPFGSGH